MNCDQFELQLFEAGLHLIHYAQGKIDIEEFLNKNDNFYYRFALDSHDPTTIPVDCLQKNHSIYKILGIVQRQLIDTVYLGNDWNDSYRELGRIPKEEAKRVVGKIITEWQFEEIMDLFRKRIGNLLKGKKDT